MAQLAIVFAFVLGTAYAVPLDTFNNKEEGRIIGGTDAADDAFPYQISLRWYDEHICGGSIISSTWVLTAAHCMLDWMSTDGITVVVGTNQLSAGGTVYKVAQLISHEDFSWITGEHDICLVEVNSNMEFGSKVKPIGLAPYDPSDGTSLVLSGWGISNVESWEVLDNLQQITLTVISISKCQSAHKNQTIFESQVCTFESEGKGACMGDSGGPLVSGDLQVGIVSWGTWPCGGGIKPDVLTSVAAHRDWIKDISGV